MRPGGALSALPYSFSLEISFAIPVLQILFDFSYVSWSFIYANSAELNIEILALNSSPHGEQCSFYTLSSISRGQFTSFKEEFVCACYNFHLLRFNRRF